MQTAIQAELVLEAGRTESQYWLDLWRYRELLYFLAWRDVLVRYKQTVIGVAWALIRPFITMVVFTIIFSKLAKLPSAGVPYPILVFTALLPWQLFSNSLADCGNSMLTNSNLISKIYFPRLIVPASAILVGFVDFLIAFSFLAGMMIWYQYPVDWRMVLLPVFTLWAIIAAGGAGLWLAALTVRYRDFRYIVPFLIQFGVYVSPVGFSSDVVPNKWRLLYSTNPMVGVIDGFRWAILSGNAHLYYPGMALSIAISALLFLSGVWYFRKTERTFADII